MGASRRDRTLHLRPRAFTLVELVMVVVIIGIVAGIAVPRMSSAATHASANAMQATLMNVRTAIECYYAEHNRYPGYDPAGTMGGSASGDHFVKQLLMYSDASGNSNATRSGMYKFGPYLRAPFPINPANNLATVHVKETRAAPNPADGSVGWVAVLATGDFGVSATDTQLDHLGVTEALGKAGARLQIN